MDQSSSRMKGLPRSRIDTLTRATSAFMAGYAQALDPLPRRSFSYQPTRDALATLMADQMSLTNDCVFVMSKIERRG